MIVFLVFCSFFQAASAIWPIPTHYQHGHEVIWIGKDVSFQLYEVAGEKEDLVGKNSNAQLPFIFASSFNTPEHYLQHGDRTLKLRKNYTQLPLVYNDVYEAEKAVSDDEIIDYTVSTTWKTIFEESLYPWKFHPRNWTEPRPSPNAIRLSHINIHLLSTTNGHNNNVYIRKSDESYTLSLTASNGATITANTSIGIARGLTTLTQLFYAHSDRTQIYTPLAPVFISDAPKFEHRGLNLDVSRNWIPVADLKRQIDALAFNKLNVLHLHATDSQSWPLDIPALPELAAKGAYRPDLIYTVKDFWEIQRHAALQGVEVVTEIDMPGHTSSIYHAYPELIAAFNVQPNWENFAAEPPSGTLKLNSTAVDAFLQKLFHDLLPRVRPFSQYFHTGGDEVNRNAYTLDDTVNSSASSVLQPLMQKLIDKSHDRVRAAGLTPIVWEEMLLEWNLTLAKDVVIQSWRSDEAVAEITARGHRVVVGNYKAWYLDCGKGQWLDFPRSNAPSYYPFNDYCAPYHNWRLIYSSNPLCSVSPENHHLVLGGEAHMWAEQTDPVNLDSMVWPRTSATAEVLWSGATEDRNGGRNRSQIEASPRLSEMRERLVVKGVRAEPVQMTYCLMGEGPECQLGWRGED